MSAAGVWQTMPIVQYNLDNTQRHIMTFHYTPTGRSWKAPRPFFFFMTMLYRHAPILVFILHKHSHCKGQLINCTNQLMQHHQKNFLQQPDSTIQATAGWANKKRKTKSAEQNSGGGVGLPPTKEKKKPMEGKTLWDKTPHTGKTQINTCTRAMIKKKNNI